VSKILVTTPTPVKQNIAKSPFLAAVPNVVKNTIVTKPPLVKPKVLPKPGK
jgi:hypothetical protein